VGGEIVVQTATAVQHDIREAIFSGISGRQFRAEVVAERAGTLAGVSRLKLAFAEAAIEAECRRNDGTDIDAGDVVATIAGSARQIAVAEEFAIGVLAKSSGIATAARRAVQLAGTGMKVVCGAWKKMPPQLKQLVREAVVCGGAAFRITDQPFLYLDKNFVRMLGGIEATLDSVRLMADKVKVIQLKGEFAPIAREALTAVHHGADILMVDTGELTDFEAAHEALRAAGCRDRVKLAFAKGIQLADLEELRGRGMDILDIGNGIVDAPLLDMRLEVLRAPHAALFKPSGADA
jgi:nicotinate-nucleotide pyrophosphorylase (carboxylating)